ncbi:PTS fructose transporter subunit IIB [Vibrio parahaemolyticus]|nr:PTS fructose transporter subunit IIB [Vibrio parahaemolyticus]
MTMLNEIKLTYKLGHFGLYIMEIVGVTACISGVAHTYMAAEALEKLGCKLGHKVTVETQGALGSENQLTQDLIDGADVAVIVSDINIEGAERFENSRVVRCSITHFLRSTEEVMGAIDKVRQAPRGAEISF